VENSPQSGRRHLHHSDIIYIYIYIYLYVCVYISRICKGVGFFFKGRKMKYNGKHFREETETASEHEEGAGLISSQGERYFRTVTRGHPLQTWFLEGL
jgi:hypothetical protein